MTITMSSQRHRDDEIVEAKRAAGDYEVFVSPKFEFEGATYRIVLDGHHSHEAAVLDGVDPIYIEQDVTENDTIGLLNDGKIDDFLQVTWMGDEYYDIETGHDVW